MAIEQVAARRNRIASTRRRPSRLQSAGPVLALVAAFAVSLFGLYALGRSIQDWVGRPGDRVTAAAGSGGAASMAKDLTRFGWSHPDVPADVLLMTPGYFHAVGWTPQRDMDPSSQLIFMVAENIHDGDLPDFSAPRLSVNGRTISAVALHTMADSPHHRTTAVVFDRPPELAAGGEAELRLAFEDGGDEGSAALRWDAAALHDAGLASPAFHLTAASLLALLGGLLASMWPCLFQLTAYFIPSLAGVSMSEARGSVSSATRWRVVKMATFFVAGFVVVYTLAGAAAGAAAQSFDTRSMFETWRRPLTIVAGSVMLLLGLRQAARARLPIVCKMPLMNRVGKGGAPGYGSAMVMGLAYATGCATCFGAAVLVGMLVYVGVAGAPFTGAAVMFLFSVGMGVPLIIGAALMAQVLPLVERFYSGARYLALMSSAMMLAMAALLLSDRFMGFSNAIAQALGSGPGVR